LSINPSPELRLFFEAALNSRSEQGQLGSNIKSLASLKMANLLTLSSISFKSNQAQALRNFRGDDGVMYGVGSSGLLCLIHLSTSGVLG
jgi:hypothetical protein